jgi:enoyl-[acyl-carrier protein] reductase II
MIKSQICDLLGIEYPIFQGGMAWVADAYLASAVSNAGGLGLIAAMNSNGEQLRSEIKKAREMTDKPFGVNIMLMSPSVEEVAKVVIEEKIKVVTTGAGNPSKFMKDWIAAGIKVIPIVPSIAIAKMVEKNGASAVVAEGNESGGHVGEITTMVLDPQIVDSVKIPVIAAGGIGDGRQLAAALMLGACGVQVGTKFLVANECTITKEYKQIVLNARDISTTTTGKRLGHPVRAIKTPLLRELLKLEYDTSISAEELEKSGAGALRLAAREGNTEKGWFMAGQVAAMVNKEQSCREIITELFEQAEKCLLEGSKWVR